MYRLIPAVLMLVTLCSLPALAQQHQHAVAMPETLKWVEPPVLPGARLAVVQVHGVGPSDLRFVNPADDPRTKK
jgi:hypothetical protein